MSWITQGVRGAPQLCHLAEADVWAYQHNHITVRFSPPSAQSPDDDHQVRLRAQSEALICAAASFGKTDGGQNAL